MGKLCFISLLGLVLSVTTWGSILELEGGPVRTISGGGRSVPIYRDATLRVGNEVHRLYLTGAGLRKKRVAFLDTDVYVAASYVDLSKGISRSGPLASLKSANARVLRLTLTRSLSAGQMRSSFEDALVANGVDLSQPELKHLLGQLTFGLPAGAVITIASWRKDAGARQENVLFETSVRTLSSRGPELGLTFWRIWFGVPADRGLQDLKAQLVGSGR